MTRARIPTMAMPQILIIARARIHSRDRARNLN